MEMEDCHKNARIHMRFETFFSRNLVNLIAKNAIETRFMSF